MRARLGRYSFWMLQDYARERGIATVLILALISLPAVLGMREQFGHGWGIHGGQQVTLVVLGTVLTTFAGAATLFAVNGISSNDRKFGYFRFLFAKPLSLPRYYATLFLVHGVGVMSILGGLYFLYEWESGTRMPIGAFTYVAIVYVLVGGIGFLLSSLTQHDGLVLILVWVFSTFLRERYADRDSAMAMLVTVFPPVDKLSDLRSPLLLGSGVDERILLWALGYGLACLALGLVVLRNRSIST